MGKAMKHLGYATAYFGKFELRRDIIYPKDTVNYEKALVEYGFDLFGPTATRPAPPTRAITPTLTPSPRATAGCAAMPTFSIARASPGSLSSA